MECGICFNIIKKSCVGPCNHHYCFLCMIRWCYHKNICPKCKTEITEIKLDPEYDYLIQEMIKMFNNSGSDICYDYLENIKISNNRLSTFNSDDIPSPLLTKTSNTSNNNNNNNNNKTPIGGGNIKEIIISFHNSTNNSKNSKNKLFVGLTLSNNDKGPGVIITNIDPLGSASISGIQIHNILLFINNVPCIHHKQTTRLLKECLASNKNAVCMVF